MYYLSIDCANKSLAVGLYNINYINDWKIKLLNILNSDNDIFNVLIECNTFLNSIVNIISLEVIDLIPKKKVKDTTIIERSIKLKKHISEIKKKLKGIDKIIHVLIEYQMNVNDKSRGVFNQLIYAFSNIQKYKIHIVIPTLKNQIYFKDELKHCRILQKYSKNYTANKVHCKENFLFFLKCFDKLELIKNIQKKNIDDIADTFMQFIGYIKYNE